MDDLASLLTDLLSPSLNTTRGMTARIWDIVGLNERSTLGGDRYGSAALVEVNFCSFCLSHGRN